MSIGPPGKTDAGTRPHGIDPTERELRVQLAACYRIFDHLGWTEMIFNHVTVRLPGPENHLLINPFGLLYHEVTASNLVRIDLDGKVVEPGDWPVNPAGVIIHTAIHSSRPDAHCVMHTHTTAGSAVACLRDGLSPDNFYSAQLAGQLAYHDFEGVTVYPDECGRLVENLADKNIMILRNHGLLTTGRTIPDAFLRLWLLQRACEIQLAAQSSGQTLTAVTAQAHRRSSAGMRAVQDSGGGAREVFEAMQRLIERKDPDYRR
ncbi:class II aldolase/adducin family protein [Frankia sp. Cas4]|uniref:class II aldolase/adducin family protein n=1 Tax=Frankia sp. Cas4 TaxID=3073927 RepID=UPI002AD24D7D|nr:class II aldolase/adducin family protein [Frankia sp. Cas4]